MVIIQITMVIDSNTDHYGYNTDHYGYNTDHYG